MADVGPAMPIEDAVARAWRRVAGTRAWAVDAPLEPAGGVSLRLLRVVFHLEAALGRSLPLDAFRRAQRPSDVAAILAHAPPSTVPDLFMLPGIGGDDPALLRLRNHLPDLAIAMITYPDWPEMDPARLDLPAVIDMAAEQIGAHAPTGPVRLAGYSLGGYLAYAVALRLIARGRVVAGLGIIDSNWTVVPRWAPFWSPGRAVNFLAALRQGDGLPSAANFAANLIWRLAPRRAERLAARRVHLPLDFGFHLRRALHMAMQLRRFRPWQTAVTSDPIPLDVEAILFRSAAQDGDPQADLGWRRCCPRLRVALLPGDHHGLLALHNIDEFCAAFRSGMGLPRPPVRIGEDR